MILAAGSRDILKHPNIVIFYMEHTLLFHDSVNCTHCNEFSHLIVNSEGQIALPANRLDEVYMGSVNYVNFTWISCLRLV